MARDNTYNPFSGTPAFDSFSTSDHGVSSAGGAHLLQDGSRAFIENPFLVPLSWASHFHGTSLGEERPNDVSIVGAMRKQHLNNWAMLSFVSRRNGGLKGVRRLHE
jgi:hypothetical protein